jgi:VIT1/CCC1 family predicted Fe2+/Mn2+ transporter
MNSSNINNFSSKYGQSNNSSKNSNIKGTIKLSNEPSIKYHKLGNDHHSDENDTQKNTKLKTTQELIDAKAELEKSSIGTNNKDNKEVVTSSKDVITNKKKPNSLNLPKPSLFKRFISGVAKALAVMLPASLITAAIGIFAAITSSSFVSAVVAGFTAVTTLVAGTAGLLCGALIVLTVTAALCVIAYVCYKLAGKISKENWFTVIESNSSNIFTVEGSNGKKYQFVDSRKKFSKHKKVSIKELCKYFKTTREGLGIHLTPKVKPKGILS